jgi:uncharacterized protein
MSKLRQRLQALLGIDDTPHRIALSFGVGVFLAWFPIYGSHTVLALLAAHLLKVSRAPALLGIWVNNPWTIVPMYMGGTIVGCVMMGMPADELWTIDWGKAVGSFRGLFEVLRPYLWPFMIGNTVLGGVGGALSYFLVRVFLERRRRAAAAAAPTRPSPT